MTPNLPADLTVEERAALGLDPKKPSILLEAEAVVNGPRAQHYGPPARNHERIALLWSAFLNGRRCMDGGQAPAVEISATEVALMMCLLKIARLQETAGHRDSLTDLAGYAACVAKIEGVDE